MNTKNELFGLCKDRAEELAHAADGELYEIDGCREVITDLDAWTDAHEGEDEPQAVTVADILGEDSLGDIHFEVKSARRTLRWQDHCRVWRSEHLD